jgi:hypothetical protein
MSAIAQCDGCKRTLPGPNTNERPKWPPRGAVPIPIHAKAISDCACGTCYLGPWTHAVPPEADPGFLRFVVYGASPLGWTDWCPFCSDVPGKLGHRIGLPLHWRLGRSLFLAASLAGALAFWAHLILWGSR